MVATLLRASAALAGHDVYDRVKDGYADDNGVRIHYASLGHGPAIVMIHGFPDFWYTWRNQMAALSRHYRTVAIDQRGYNLSDKPAGVESYDLLLLVADVAAVVHDIGEEKAIIVGHDWGGVVAWMFATLHPEMTDRLIILNTPHPRALIRELRTNPAQQLNSLYARIFQGETGATSGFTAKGLSGWVQEPEARAHYIEAFGRSDFDAMLNYYKRNYPREPYADVPLPKVQAPVLVVYGLKDPFLLPAGLNGTWEYLEQDLTLVTVPTASHFVQEEEPALVTKAMKIWLGRPRARGR
jgi:pimeloyl-ACP methyl ester carboxylesterase